MEPEQPNEASSIISSEGDSEETNDGQPFTNEDRHELQQRLDKAEKRLRELNVWRNEALADKQTSELEINTEVRVERNKIYTELNAKGQVNFLKAVRRNLRPEFVDLLRCLVPKCEQFFFGWRCGAAKR